MTPPIPLADHGLRYPEAVIRRVVDGDTVDVTLYVRDSPFPGVRRTDEYDRRLRIAHIDAPDKPAAAKAAATRFAASVFPAGTAVTVDLYDPDKYGRDLATVRLGGRSWAEVMLLADVATVPYEGGTRG
jgi:endonuclease YncB( thermonuclease family)